MDSVVRVPLSNGKFAIVDAGDASLVEGYNWSDKGNGYAMAWNRGIGGFVLMHRLIARAPKGLDVDHINHDTLDNRRANLRVCSRKLNNHNRRGANRGAKSKYIGVGWSNARQAWIGSFRGKYLGIGRGPEGEIEMARRHDAAVVAAYGSSARLNFSQESQP